MMNQFEVVWVPGGMSLDSGFWLYESVKPANGDPQFNKVVRLHNYADSK